MLLPSALSPPLAWLLSAEANSWITSNKYRTFHGMLKHGMVILVKEGKRSNWGTNENKRIKLNRIGVLDISQHNECFSFHKEKEKRKNTYNSHFLQIPPFRDKRKQVVLFKYILYVVRQKLKYGLVFDGRLHYNPTEISSYSLFSFLGKTLTRSCRIHMVRVRVWCLQYLL